MLFFVKLFLKIVMDKSVSIMKLYEMIEIFSLQPHILGYLAMSLLYNELVCMCRRGLISGLIVKFKLK